MVSTQTGDGRDESQRVNADTAATEGDSGIAGDASLEETAAREREYLRGRLRDELQRDPTEEELDEWLREHTEGH